MPSLVFYMICSSGSACLQLQLFLLLPETEKPLQGRVDWATLSVWKGLNHATKSEQKQQNELCTSEGFRLWCRDHEAFRIISHSASQVFSAVRLSQSTTCWSFSDISGRLCSRHPPHPCPRSCLMLTAHRSCWAANGSRKDLRHKSPGVRARRCAWQLDLRNSNISRRMGPLSWAVRSKEPYLTRPFESLGCSSFQKTCSSHSVRGRRDVSREVPPGNPHQLLQQVWPRWKYLDSWSPCHFPRGLGKTSSQALEFQPPPVFTWNRGW